MDFQHEEDRCLFEYLLCSEGESLEAYAALFDFRSPELKRRESRAVVTRVLEDYRERRGVVCLLRCSADCDLSRGITVDHVIPISTNELNKHLRGMTTSRSEDGKLLKVPPQSFGSNHHRNLVPACCPCNDFKKHRLLAREHLAATLIALATGVPPSRRLERSGDWDSLFWCRGSAPAA